MSHRARERDDNLLFVRERLLRSEVDTPSLLALYGKIRSDKRVRDEEANPLVSVLRLSGITSVAKGYLKVRNRVYYRVFDSAWITANLPGAELRRQRAAYRKGMWRATAWAVPVLLVVIALAWNLLYRNQTNLTPSFKAPEPPVFWLSGTEQLVGSLATRTPEAQACANVHHEIILQGELTRQFDLTTVFERPLLGGGKPVQLGDKKGIIFQRSPEEEALERWSHREFLQVERSFAKKSIRLDA